MIEVDQFFVGFEAIEHRLKSLSQYGTGRLSIAVHPALGNAFMPRALAAHDLESRDIRVSLRILSSREVHQQVSTGQCDFGLMADEMPVHGLEHSAFMDTPGVMVMAPSHALANKDRIEPLDLENVDFLALNPEDSSRRRLEAALLGSCVKPKIRVETPYAHTICEMATHGMGIGFVNPIAAVDYLGRGLAIRPFALDVPFSSILLFRPNNPLSDTARQLIRRMRIQLEKDLRRLQRAISAVDAGPGARFSTPEHH
ncbi:hypothetical protein GCM10009304_11670 [Pseudomonas matsuisoli]|uniref:LysR substrate-binding domain-containing protein n=2 Tax=Pseudomonas matsuisoli TaxID=1515666 RepID=A0A917PQP6_9PSED|nr:hypothetical protein GCM10009304_11670 [Pseudomonas matsuisoli]